MLRAYSLQNLIDATYKPHILIMNSTRACICDNHLYLQFLWRDRQNVNKLEVSSVFLLIIFLNSCTISLIISSFLVSYLPPKSIVQVKLNFTSSSVSHLQAFILFNGSLHKPKAFFPHLVLHSMSDSGFV